MRSPGSRVVTLVLCTPGGDVLGELPPFPVEVPWWQDAEAPVRGAWERHRAHVRILRLLSAALPSPPGGAVTYLAEVDAPPEGVVRHPFGGHLDDHPLRLPYAEPGGPERDLRWATAALEERGFRQVAAAEQVRTWNLSSLWRIPVDGETLWLKCVPPFFAHEGPVVTRLPAGMVPELVAHADGRILMREIVGEDQYDAPLPTLLALVSVLVDVQAGGAGRLAELVSLGVPDWRATSLPPAVDAVVRRTARALSGDDRRTLNELVETMPERFAALVACGIPDSLVHGDFAPGNARGDGRRLVLLDWGDCGVGHPLLDQSAFTDRIPAGLVPAVGEHWHRSWRQAVPGCDPVRAAELVAPLAAARMAVSYQGFLDRIEPSEHPYHRGDPLLWLSRAAALARAASAGM